MSRTRIIVLALIALVAVMVLFKFCGKDDDAEIRALISEMVAAAEARNTQEFMKHFSLKYKDSSGNSYFVIQNLVKRTLDTLEELKVEIRNPDITVAGDTAFVSMEVITRARMRGRMSHPFGSEQRPEIPRLTLKKERMTWKITKVEGVDRGGYFSDF